MSLICFQSILTDTFTCLFVLCGNISIKTNPFIILDFEDRNHFSHHCKLQEDQDNKEEEVEEASYDDEEYEYEVSLSHDPTVKLNVWWQTHRCDS